MSDRPAPDGEAPVPPQRGPGVGDELELVVEKLVTGGDGLARHEGLPLFVARAAPGDRVRARVWQRKRDYGRAEILEVLAPGPARREPPCPYFAECGGCDLQHLDEAAQLEAKVAATRETLERIGRVEWPERVEVVAGEPWGYRLRARLRLEGDDSSGGADSPAVARVGYLARASNDLVAVDRCPILAPELEALLPVLPRAAGSRPPSKLEIAAGDDGVTLSPPVEGLPRGAVTRQVGELTYAFDARTFFQAHRHLLPRLVELAVGDWRGETACDLFSGVGLFALPLARRYARVTAVEGDRAAVRYLKRNARENGLGNVAIVGRAIESWTPELPEGVDRVLVDPPRIGLHVRTREQLLKRPPERLTYVSCQPASLARDLIWLQRGFVIESLAIVDLFPQTGHVETVAQLVRRG
ncbi:MAG: class I SAM-dependent RNA methyltransferase [Thermoanaerobaculia bacterium]|nr:class I SAM-dependent RNA methyltransferase [Thermoanaerobaculia bacterium]